MGNRFKENDKKNRRNKSNRKAEATRVISTDEIAKEEKKRT